MPWKKTTWRERLRSKRFTSVSDERKPPGGRRFPFCRNHCLEIIVVAILDVKKNVMNLHGSFLKNWSNYSMLLLIVQKSGQPVEVGSLSHSLQGFIHPFGGWPWDFWTINSMCTYHQLHQFHQKHRVDQGNNTSFNKPWHLWRKNNPNLSSHFPHVHVAIFDKQIPGKQPLACCSFSINFILKTSHPVA